MKGTVIKCEEKRWPTGAVYHSIGINTPEGKLYGTAKAKDNPAIQSWLLTGKTVLFEVKQDGDFKRFHDMGVIVASVSQEPPPPKENDKHPPSREMMIARECSAKLTEAVMLRRAELGLDCTLALLGRVAKFWAEFIETGEVPYSESGFESQELFKIDIGELVEIGPKQIRVDQDAPTKDEEPPQEPEKDLSLSDMIREISRLKEEVGGELEMVASKQLSDGISKSDGFKLLARLRASKKAMKV